MRKKLEERDVELQQLKNGRNTYIVTFRRCPLSN